MAHGDLITAYLRPFLLDSNNMPEIERATYVEDLEPRLSTHFLAFSSNPDAPRAWLTPRAVDLLVAWAERHPVTGNGSQLRPDDEFNLLTVLVSPNGLWVMCHKVIVEPAKIQELAALGVALAQAQKYKN